MPILRKVLPAFLIACGFLPMCSGCRSDGNTTRIDYTYQRPVWTDASFERPSKEKN